MSVTGLLDEIAGAGRDRLRGGYSRHGFDAPERELRAWFTEQASRRHLDVETDRNGNLWAWWGAPGPDAVVTGSHLDSVPGGGAFDGPLGATSAGLDPERVGQDREAVARMGCFVERHVEQGRALGPMSRPLGVASSIVAHGRWRFTITGQGNHAGTTLIGDRADPMLPPATAVTAARRAATDAGAVATIGRLVPRPGGTNVIPSVVDFWLDSRAGSAAETRAVVEQITRATRESAEAEGARLSTREESFGDAVSPDPGLRDELASLLDDLPRIPKGAGHDAGIRAAQVPTAMLFVRNPTGISHAPEEHAAPDDCERGARALAEVVERLAR